jgi:hypothetical protein
MRVFTAAIAIFLTTLLFEKASWSWDPSQYINLPLGSQLEIEIPRLHPTQFRVGQVEVDDKSVDFVDMGPKKLTEYLKDHPCPVVVGPDGTFYITDEQHRANASTKSEHRRVLKTLMEHDQPTMYAKVIDSYPVYVKQCEARHQKPQAFDKWMVKKNYTFLYDRGELRSFDELPKHVTDMKNDAYRSLAGFLERKAYELKAGVYFAQFKVANWLRQKLGLSDHEVDDLLTGSHSERKKFLKRVSHLLESRSAQSQPWHQTPLYVKKDTACLIDAIQGMAD